MYGIFELYKKYNKQKVVQTIKNSLIILGVACLILLVFYKFVSIKEYFLGMKFAAKYIKNAQVAFLSGQYSKSGFWWYFIYTFLLKTPLAFLIFLVVVFFKNIINGKVNCKTNIFLLSVPLILLIIASMSPMHIGHRHILPIYHFYLFLPVKLF